MRLGRVKGRRRRRYKRESEAFVTIPTNPDPWVLIFVSIEVGVPVEKSCGVAGLETEIKSQLRHSEIRWRSLTPVKTWRDK
jgi:hypothetical protein